MVGIADPREPVSALLDRHTTDLAEQRVLVGSSTDRLVDRRARLQRAVESKDLVLGLLPPMAHAQGLEAECQIVGGFHEHLPLLLVECIGFRRSDGQCAVDLAFDTQRQRQQ